MTGLLWKYDCRERGKCEDMKRACDQRTVFMEREGQEVKLGKGVEPCHRALTS